MPRRPATARHTACSPTRSRRYAKASSRGTRAAPTTRAFLFSDLRGYTSFVEKHGDRAAARLLRDYRALVRREVARLNGAEIKTEGDSFYVVFESPIAALDCAATILRRTQTRNAKQPDATIEVGIGLHAGEVLPHDDQYVGSAVIVAARLCSKAQTGELVISDTFRGLIRTGHSYAMTDLGALELKGLSEPIRAWSVDWRESASRAAARAGAKPAPALVSAAPREVSSGHLVCPVLIGRDAELGRARERLTQIAAGRGGLLLVGGEAGIGKSSLTREIESDAVTRGYRLLSGAALESDGAVPYAPFLSAVRSAFRGSELELRRIVAASAPDLAQAFPELGTGGQAAGSPEMQRLSFSFRAFFSALAQEAPLVLVLEDLHWSDEASLALVQHLARELQRAPALVLATYRTDEMHRRHPLARVIAALQRERLVDEIVLRRLEPEQLTEMIRSTFGGAEREPTVSPEFRDAIFARTEGNPFFTEELLKALVESGDLAYSDEAGWRRTRPIEQLRIPGSIREAVRAHVERLSAEAQDTLGAAAVIGSQFGFDVLAAVRGISESELALHLREAIDQQLVSESGSTTAPSYAFRHALTREVIYEELLLPERRRLHLRAAAALKDDLEAAIGAIAQHWSLGGDRSRAAEAHAAAGKQALALHAPVEAVAHFESALEARGDATPDDYFGLASAYSLIDFAKARDAADRGIALLPPDGDLERRVELMYIAGRARWWMGDFDGNFDFARAAVDLVREAPQGRAKARAYDWLASAYMTRQEMTAAARLAESALATARVIGDPAIQASALTTLAGTIAVREPSRALPMLDDAAAIARRAATPEVMSRIHFNGVYISFVVETERQRTIRLGRASEFTERYGRERGTVTAYDAVHRFAGATWPPDGSLARGLELATHAYATWVQTYEAMIRCARSGPTEEARADVRAVIAAAGAEPQAHIPFLSCGAILDAWAGDDDSVAAAANELAHAASTVEHGALVLVSVARGCNAPSATLALARRPDVLNALVRALEGLDDYTPDRHAVNAFLLALDGDAAGALEEIRAASVGLRRRGDLISIPLDVYAIARTIPLDGSWRDMVAEADAVLEKAGATWFRSELARLTAGAR